MLKTRGTRRVDVYMACEDEDEDVLRGRLAVRDAGCTQHV
jgi:hypothetical protein